MGSLTAYDGNIVNVALDDIPAKKSDLVVGKYEIPAPADETTVASRSSTCSAKKRRPQNRVGQPAPVMKSGTTACELLVVSAANGWLPGGQPMLALGRNWA